MVPEANVLGVAVATRRTREGFLARVYTHMALQLGSSIESLRAVTTLLVLGVSFGLLGRLEVSVLLWKEQFCAGPLREDQRRVMLHVRLWM